MESIQTLSFLMFMSMTMYIVIKKANKKSENKEFFLFVSLMLFTSYTGVAAILSLPLLPFIEPMEAIFRPVGAWLENIFDKMPKK